MSPFIELGFYIPIFLRLPLGVVLLALLGVGGWFALRPFLRWSTGWKVLAAKYPMAEVHRTGAIYAGQGAFYYNRLIQGRLSSSLRIEIAQEGLLVTASFARRLPALVPWDAITNAEVMDLLGELHLTVQYGERRTIIFRLPASALTAVRQFISGESVRQRTVLQMLMDRVEGRE